MVVLDQSKSILVLHKKFIFQIASIIIHLSYELYIPMTPVDICICLFVQFTVHDENKII